MAEFSKNRHISNLINMSCKVLLITERHGWHGYLIAIVTQGIICYIMKGGNIL